jgi:hypothetical protein
MSNDKTQQFPPVSAERIKRRRDVNFDSPDPDDREIAAICQMALDSITPSHEATVGETAEERRLRHRLEKIDAALDELGAPKTEAAHGLTMELSRVGRIKRLAQSATATRWEPFDRNEAKRLIRANLANQINDPACAYLYEGEDGHYFVLKDAPPPPTESGVTK